MISRLCNVSRALIIPARNSYRSIHTGQPSFVALTPVYYAEPLKKKKKIDPAVLKQREERKKKKIEKQIRRLEKNARQLKPIDELEVPYTLIDEQKQRLRTTVSLSPPEVERRENLQKLWAHHKLKENVDNFQQIEIIRRVQFKALEELRKESEELYQEAIQFDMKLLPITLKGPVKTPHKQNYNSPDGEYFDISKKWE